MTTGIDTAGWNLHATYASLPDAFWERAEPARFPEPRLVIANETLARDLGLDLSRVASDELEAFTTGQRLPVGAMPIAQAYAGHQYGHGTMLGDGRAILVGEQRTPSGALVDLHLKGAGQTPFSRRGDGRAALGPMLREYLVSEAMHALGVPTTRSLAVATTGETIPRDGPRQGAVLARTAASHIRVGTFEYAAALGDRALLAALAGHAISRHDPDLSAEPDRHARFLSRVIARQAALVAQWQCIGFVHGVMNTDNMTVSGETIDYGPCAFLDAYHADAVFSSIDRHGRYAFGRQPAIAHWNLARLAESLVPLLAADEHAAIARANEALDAFPALFREAWLGGMRRKIGLASTVEGDLALFQDLLDAMQREGADFTRTFRALTAADALRPEAAPAEWLAPWIERWHARLASDANNPDAALRAMQSANPRLIPRNHLVEQALAAADSGDLAPFRTLLDALRTPFTLAPAHAHLDEPPPPEFRCYKTFCGT
ncbi:MAG: YdiU family protein [Planctomycetaceae bacterium]|nr:YdiU family protein [Planctomycetaceae bacterium]